MQPDGEEAGGRFVPGLEVWPAVWPARRSLALLRRPGLPTLAVSGLCPRHPPPTPAQRRAVKSLATRTSVWEGLATAQTDSFDCSHPGVPRLPGCGCRKHGHQRCTQ